MFRKKKKQRSDPEEVAIAAALQAAASVHTGHLPHRQGSRESAVQTSHRGLQQAASNHTQVCLAKFLLKAHLGLTPTQIIDV